MENVDRAIVLGLPRATSMGPRLLGRGKRRRRRCRRPSRRYFNGATAIRPWKTRRNRDASVWRHHFNGATAIRPWKTSVFARTRADVTHFNGATAIRPWKTGFTRPWTCCSGLTSMGPRLLGRGKRANALSQFPGGGDFNGATAIRPWKTCQQRCHDALTVALQWGHGY